MVPELDLSKIKGMSPLQLFELFFDNDVIGYIVSENNKYALAKGATGWNDVTADELRCFFGILMVSGYNQLPGRKMYWEESPDVHNTIISEAMRRNRFLDLLRYVHFCDNNNLDGNDKCSKVRPISNMVVERFQKYAYLTHFINFDESMVEYYDESGNALKQRMPQKPVRRGYKVWCLLR